MDDVIAPEARQNLIGHIEVERQLRASLDEGGLNHGWIIAGPSGIGKATLAFRIARALLDPKALTDPNSLEVPSDARVFRLVAGRAHPDLFVAQREWDEKKSRYETEIPVDKIRKLITFLNSTASGGGWRVAIIDAADDLNRNASNALLKALEEPPARTLIMLVANAPGRLIPTIRSRCRRLNLRQIKQSDIERFLDEEGVATSDDARLIASAARGRPGRALQLAANDGVEAVACVDSFFHAATSSGDFGPIAMALSGKTDQGKWALFKELVLERLSEAARVGAMGDCGAAPFSGVCVESLLDAWEKLSSLSVGGDALNLDRSQLIFAMGRDLRLSLDYRLT